MSYIYKKVGSEAGQIQFHYELTGVCVGRIDSWIEEQSTPNYFSGVPLTDTYTFQWPASTTMEKHTITATPVIYIDGTDTSVCSNRTIVIEQSGIPSKCDNIEEINISNNIPQDAKGGYFEIGTLTLAAGMRVDDVRFTKVDETRNGRLEIGKIGTVIYVYANEFPTNYLLDNVSFDFYIECKEANGTWTECETVTVYQEGLKESCSCYAMINYHIRQRIISVPTLSSGAAPIEVLAADAHVKSNCSDITLKEANTASTAGGHLYEVRTEKITGADWNDYKFYTTFYPLEDVRPGHTQEPWAVNYNIDGITCEYVSYIMQGSCGTMNCPPFIRQSDIVMVDTEEAASSSYPSYNAYWEDITIPWRICGPLNMNKIVSLGYANGYIDGRQRYLGSYYTSGGSCTIESFSGYGGVSFGLTIEKVNSEGYELVANAETYQPDFQHGGSKYAISNVEIKHGQKHHTNWTNSPITATYKASFNHDMKQGINLDPNLGVQPTDTRYGFGGVECKSRNFNIIQEAFPTGCTCDDFDISGITYDGYIRPLNEPMYFAGDTASTEIKIISDCFDYYGDSNDPLCSHKDLARYHINTANTDNWLTVRSNVSNLAVMEDVYQQREYIHNKSIPCYGRVSFSMTKNDGTENRETTFDVEYTDPNGNTCTKTVTINQYPYEVDCTADSCDCDKMILDDYHVNVYNGAYTAYTSVQFRGHKTGEVQEGICVTESCSGGDISLTCISGLSTDLNNGTTTNITCGGNLSTTEHPFTYTAVTYDDGNVGINMSFQNLKARSEVDRTFVIKVTHTGGAIGNCAKQFNLVQRGCINIRKCEQYASKIQPEYPVFKTLVTTATSVYEGERIVEINRRYTFPDSSMEFKIVNNNEEEWELEVEKESIEGVSFKTPIYVKVKKVNVPNMGVTATIEVKRISTGEICDTYYISAKT